MPLQNLPDHTTAGLADADPRVPVCPEGARLIPLTRGYFAIVDEADFERVNAFKWTALVKACGTVYAKRTAYLGGGRKAQIRKQILLHRFLLAAPDDVLVDHRDGDGRNNCRRNIRIATVLQNQRNRRKRSGAQRFKGIARTPSGFKALIGVNRRKIYIGHYPTDVEAALAYDAAARRHFGEFANLNFPDGYDVGPAAELPCQGPVGELLSVQDNMRACFHGPTIGDGDGAWIGPKRTTR